MRFSSSTLVSLFSFLTSSLVEGRSHPSRCDGGYSHSSSAPTSLAPALNTTAFGPGFPTIAPPPSPSTTPATTRKHLDAKPPPSSSTSTPASTAVARRGGHSIDFSTYNAGQAAGSETAEQLLNRNGYLVSDYAIDDDGVAGSIPRTFKKSNVDIVNGALRLKVDGQASGGKRSTIVSGEIESIENVTYGTLETWAKATPVQGVCQGVFFYESDHAEIDIELLSSYYTEGYKQYLSGGVQFTNQALVANADSTTLAQRYGFDPTQNFHNYTIVWTAQESRFYIDGEFRQSFDTNVPVGIPSKVIFNNWSNGDPKWSAGPPQADAYFEIKSFKYTPLA
ncbi:hypothetical protein JCM3766R1_000824 [Sporobolomyces carnicolor]